MVTGDFGDSVFENLFAGFVRGVFALWPVTL